MVLRLISCSPRRRIRLVTVIRGLRFVEARSGSRTSTELTPATGARTTRLHRPRAPISAKGFDGLSAVRPRAIRQLTGLVDPPCHPLTSPDALASTASRPASVTIASRPLCGTGRPTYITDLGQAARKISEIQKLTAGLLRDGGDSRFHGLIPYSSLSPAREAIVASCVWPIVLRQLAPWRT